MGTWKTEVNKVVNDVGNAFSTVTNKVQDTFGTTVNRTISDVNSFFANGTTVVGISAPAIPAMKTAIRNYVNDIKTALDALKNSDPTVAFKGEHVQALKTYIESIKTVCGAIASHMLAFNDELTKVEAAYHSKEEASGSAISSDAESLSSTYTEYQETSQSNG